MYHVVLEAVAFRLARTSEAAIVEEHFSKPPERGPPPVVAVW